MLPDFVQLSQTLSLYVLFPLVLAVPAAALGRLKLESIITDVFSTLGMLFLAVLSFFTLLQSQNPLRLLYAWPSFLHANLHLDGLSALFLVTINLIGFAVALYSISYMRHFTSRGYFWALFLVMVGAMNGLVLASDLFTLYVFVELAAIASYALVAFGCEAEDLEASFKYLVQGSIGSALILLGIAILYNLTGTLSISDLPDRLSTLGANPVLLLAAGLLLVGFSVKTALVPFHAWLPDAHPSAPAPISAMLSGVLIKAVGVYSLCRIFFGVIGLSPALAWLLIYLGAISMIVGVFLAIGQIDLKRLLAYHSSSQMGYVVLSIGVGAEVLPRPDLTPALVGVASLAIFGGLFHLFNHAVFKSLLFLASGSFEQQTGTRILSNMGGLATRMPVTSTCCRVASVSIAGVPPFNGFFSKLIILIAVVSAGHYWLAAATVFVSFMTLCSFIKVQRYALHGELPHNLRNVREAPVLMCAGMILLTVVCCLGGLGVLYYGPVLFDPAVNMLTAKYMPYYIDYIPIPSDPVVTTSFDPGARP